MIFSVLKINLFAKISVARDVCVFLKLVSSVKLACLSKHVSNVKHLFLAVNTLIFSCFCKFF